MLDVVMIAQKVAFCLKNKASYITRSSPGTGKSPLLSMGLPLFEKNIIGSYFCKQIVHHAFKLKHF
jgi:hypothetical protein